jgi:hypothetical protein
MSTVRVLVAGGATIGLLAFSQFVAPVLLRTTYEQEVTRTTSTGERVPSVVKEPVDVREVVTHTPLPKAVKAIYMTSCVVGTPSFRDSLVRLIERTEVNSVIIDIKDFSGTLSFAPQHEMLRGAWQASMCGARDMKEFVALLHEKGIYVIGRITVFQDPYYTGVHPDLAVHKRDGSVWKDFKGLSFVDVSARGYWDYIIALGEDAYNLGFDELNFDYVRFPSDGNMSDIVFTHTGTMNKQVALETFFQYLNTELSRSKRFDSIRHEKTGRASTTPYLSVDLFGMTTTNIDDLSIGQVLERAVPYFDFIAPMVYPSHYPKTFLGLGNPNDHPYKVVHYAMEGGVRRMSATTTPNDAFPHERMGTSTPALYIKPMYDIQKLRPWIQDFDYGGDYDATDVRAQIQATYDVGLTSWMIWAPSNIYTEGALLAATSTVE